jgi:hypothetical protein
VMRLGVVRKSHAQRAMSPLSCRNSTRRRRSTEQQFDLGICHPAGGDCLRRLVWLLLRPSLNQRCCGANTWFRFTCRPEHVTARRHARRAFGRCQRGHGCFGGGGWRVRTEKPTTDNNQHCGPFSACRPAPMKDGFHCPAREISVSESVCPGDEIHDRQFIRL